MAAVVYEQIEVTPRDAPGGDSLRRGGAMFGPPRGALLRAAGAPRPLDRALRSHRDELERGAPGAERCLFVRRRRAGRDVLSRIIWGTRASILAGVVSVRISMALGVPIGMLAGYLGRWVDAIISRITDAMLASRPDPRDRALPPSSAEPDQRHDSRSASPPHRSSFALTRAQVLAAKSEDYVEARAPPATRTGASRCATSPEHRRAAHRPGNARHRRGGDRRGQPLVPGFRSAAAGAELGQHAQHLRATTRPGAVDGDLARVSIFLLVLVLNLLRCGRAAKADRADASYCATK